MLVRLLRYFKESKEELAQVVWPEKNRGLQLTIAVVVVSMAVGLYLGLLDLLFTQALGFLINR